MKNILVLLSLIISGHIFSQECKAYFPLNEGAKLEYTEYNKKDKITGYNSQEIISKTSENGIETVRIKSTSTDDKKENEYSHEFDVECTGSGFRISMQSLMDEETMGAYENMQIDVNGDFIEYPSNLNESTQLDDAHMDITVSNEGIKIITLHFDVTNRKVEGTENIITEAGAFPCVKISYTTTIKLGFITKNTKTTTWISEGIGAVRTELYNANEKPISYTMLTGLNR